MSLTTLGSEPQPSLAWTFESSNVDYVTNLAPSSQVSPGPAQLQGSAVLTNTAPTSNTAVYFPGTTGSYMNLGTSSPSSFSLVTSNILVEAWIYLTSIPTRNVGIMARSDPLAPANGDFRLVIDSTGAPLFFIRNLNSSIVVGSPLTLNQWYHVAGSWSLIPSSNTVAVFTNGTLNQSKTELTATAYTSTRETHIGYYNSGYFPGYIRDIRVVQGGVVPTTSFTPGAAPFSYALPSYVTGSGSTVFTLLGQFITYNPSGKYGKSVVIQNDVSQVNGNNSISWNAAFNIDSGITVSFWVKVQQIGTNTQTLLQYGGTAGASTIIFNMNNNGTVAMWFRDATYHTITSSALSVNTWNHLCISIGSGNVAAYLNGVSQGTTTYTPSGSTVNNFKLGAYGDSRLTPSTGEYDDLRIYNTALTAAQVQSIYTQGGAPASSFRVTPQPRLAWDFNGTVAPYIGSATGTVTGTVPYSSGKFGQSIVITNTAGVVAANYVSWSTGTIFTTQGTQTLWIKTNTIGTGSQYFLEFGGSSGGISYALALNSTNTVNIRVQAIGGVITNISTVTALQVGTWHHIAVVMDGSAHTVYIDGVLSAGPNPSNTTGFTYSNPRIGGSTGLARVFISGEIDDLRIYDTALSAAQVQSIYRAQGMPSRCLSNNKSFSLPNVPGYTYIPLYALPSSFTLVNSSTSNAWTYGGGLLTDGGANPVLNLVATAPNNIYSAVNPGIWYSLNRVGSTTDYVRHQVFTMKLAGFTGASFDWAWAFFLKNGTSNQIIIYNAYAGGYWVQSNGINIRIGTQVQADAFIYTISSTVNNPPMNLIGTPLFSQLSASATSSAVGAFSLRAVNERSAKAVNVVAGGVFPITGFSTSATQSTNQFTQNLAGAPFSGNYVANCSTFYSVSGTEQPWRCFDKNNNGTWWTTSTGSYSTSTGLYTAGVYSTTISGSAYAGEWIQIQLPAAIMLISYTIYNSSTFNSRAPVDFKIAGSNDGITWTLVDTQTAITSWLSLTTSLTFTPSIQTTAYSYYRLCVNKYGGASGGYLTIGELVINGTVPSLAQDFYADRLGNLLTAPVTGQTLANWLGGATGYVTAWYDQSGRGNHATQTTAANQPIIQRATKGPGYMVNFNGTSQFVTLSASYNFLNGTNLTLNAVALRTATKAGANFIFGTNSGSVAYQRIAIGFEQDTTVDPLGNLTSSPGGVISAYSSSDPVYYMTGVLSPSRIVYLNDQSIGTNVDTGLLNAPAGTSFSIGYGVWYYQGNLFELLIFTTALDQTQITRVYQNQLAYTGT